MVKLGVIGTGKMAERFCQIITEDKLAELRGVVAQNFEKTEIFANRFKTQAFKEVEDLCRSDDIEAILICSPDSLHCKHAVMALECKKHVLLEKPMATTLEECQEIMDSAKEVGALLFIGQTFRFNGAVMAIKKLLKEEDIGEVYNLNLHWGIAAHEAQSWRSDGRLSPWWNLSAMGVHCVDIIRFLLNERCGEVVDCKSLLTSHRFKTKNEDQAHALLEFESGATASFKSTLNYRHPMSVEIDTEKGRVSCLDLVHHQRIVQFNDQVIEVPKNVHWKEQLLSFFDSVESHLPVAVSGVEGMKNVEILLKLKQGSPEGTQDFIN